MNKNNVIFILVRPNFLGNIGSTARVMKNFGFSQLRLVNPPRNYLDAEARKMAVDAFDVLKKAKVETSLSNALSDISVAFSTSPASIALKCRCHWAILWIKSRLRI